MLTFGTLSLKSKLVLAPLAGISDLPFRLLNRRFGCELAFVEMINARSLCHKNIRTRQMLSMIKDDRPLGVQILGIEPRFIAKAMGVLEGYEFDVLDFNAACPAKKIVRRGEGAAMLKDPKNLAQILKLLVRLSRVPVTLKIRSGWDKDSVNAVEVAKAAQDAGVAGIFIHGRTRMQGYSGTVDYAAIRDVKKAVRVPVVASGDILSAELARKMFDETGCDGLAVARGALGNPWIFREIEEYMRSGKVIAPPSIAAAASLMREHLQESVEFHGDRVGVVMFRKFFAWYTKGWRGIRPLREKCSRIRTLEEMLSLIDACRKKAMPR